jgi:hypothetical protein
MYCSGLTNQTKGLQWRKDIALDVSQELLKSFYASPLLRVSLFDKVLRPQVQLHDVETCFSWKQRPRKVRLFYSIFPDLPFSPIGSLLSKLAAHRSSLHLPLRRCCHTRARLVP